MAKRKCPFKISSYRTCDEPPISPYRDHCADHAFMMCKCSAQATHYCRDFLFGECKTTLCDNPYCTRVHNIDDHIKKGHI